MTIADRLDSPRVAVVTGAGTGIGAAIAGALAAAGIDLLLHYREHGRTVEQFAETCRTSGRRVEVVQADFAVDPSLAGELVDTAVARLGRIDILVNNAAVTSKTAPLESLGRNLFEETLAVNLVAPFLAIQAAAPHMIAAGRGGRIVNIGSVHGRVVAPGFAAYEASKAGIASLTASAAIALGPHAITVNCVAPGSIVVERYAEQPWDESWVVSRTPIGRTGTPDDIAAVVAFCVSEAAGFLTGETIYVDGGMTRRMALVR
ncbi:MAG: SDR family oxidoreductase [Chloroflexi bacterium]|nr:SDR family oxidoreductase [Chloroflexota bacterium]